MITPPGGWRKAIDDRIAETGRGGVVFMAAQSKDALGRIRRSCGRRVTMMPGTGARVRVEVAGGVWERGDTTLT
jgi:hypothetical protein